MLLAENRFNDSKEFYEAHKKQINEQVVIPMRCIVADLSGLLETINPDFILDAQVPFPRAPRHAIHKRQVALSREPVADVQTSEKRAADPRLLV